MRKVALLLILTSTLALGDCDKSLGLCDAYAKTLQIDVSTLKKERDDLKQSLADTQKALKSAEHPLIPVWVDFAVGFLVGALGLRLVSK